MLMDKKLMIIIIKDDGIEIGFADNPIPFRSIKQSFTPKELAVKTNNTHQYNNLQDLDILKLQISVYLHEELNLNQKEQGCLLVEEPQNSKKSKLNFLNFLISTVEFLYVMQDASSFFTLNSIKNQLNMSIDPTNLDGIVIDMSQKYTYIQLFLEGKKLKDYNDIFYFGYNDVNELIFKQIISQSENKDNYDLILENKTEIANIIRSKYSNIEAPDEDGHIAYSARPKSNPSKEINFNIKLNKKFNMIQQAILEPKIYRNRESVSLQSKLVQILETLNMDERARLQRNVYLSGAFRQVHGLDLNLKDLLYQEYKKVEGELNFRMQTNVFDVYSSTRHDEIYNGAQLFLKYNQSQSFSKLDKTKLNKIV